MTSWLGSARVIAARWCLTCPGAAFRRGRSSLRAAAQGNPAAIAPPITWTARLVERHGSVANATFGAIRRTGRASPASGAQVLLFYAPFMHGFLRHGRAHPAQLATVAPFPLIVWGADQVRRLVVRPATK
jgi:hypothetical protein